MRLNITKAVAGQTQPEPCFLRAHSNDRLQVLHPLGELASQLCRYRLMVPTAEPLFYDFLE